MSWLFSRALVEASSAVISSDGALYAPSSATPTPPPFSPLGKTTRRSHPFPSGMTCERLTADHGEDVLTFCLAASPVRTSAPPDKAPALTASAQDSGARWPGSLAKYDPLTSSWKTPQSSLLAGLDAFSGTWPRWGTMRIGECSERTTRAPLIGETESGSWHTPTVKDRYGASPKEIEMMTRQAAGEHIPTTFRRLRSQVATWPTPDTCAGGTGPSQTKRNDPRLQDVVKWATPCARDGKEQTLSPALAVIHNDKTTSRQLPRQMSAESPELHGGKLNPMWVEWLMGWPLGWTDLQPLATDKFRQWCASHGGASG